MKKQWSYVPRYINPKKKTIILYTKLWLYLEFIPLPSNITGGISLWFLEKEKGWLERLTRPVNVPTHPLELPNGDREDFSEWINQLKEISMGEF